MTHPILSELITASTSEADTHLNLCPRCAALRHDYEKLKGSPPPLEAGAAVLTAETGAETLARDQRLHPGRLGAAVAGFSSEDRP